MIRQSAARLNEPIPISEVFATGMLPVEHCGEFVRITYFSEQPVIGFDERERIVVCKIVIPISHYRAMAALRIESPCIAG